MRINVPKLAKHGYRVEISPDDQLIDIINENVDGRLFEDLAKVMANHNIDDHIGLPIVEDACMTVDAQNIIRLCK